MQDHFTRLGLPRRFALEPAEVERQYLARSRAVHPDYHAAGSSADLAASLELSAAVNEAYNTLRDPFTRADYLLTLEGGPAASEQKQMPPAFLAEMLELRERVEEARTGDAPAVSGLAGDFAARSDAMRGTAYLLCGDWHRAEDLVQTAFTKLYLAWGRVSRHEVLDAYVRQMLVRTFLDERRRGWWRRERTTSVPVDGALPPDTPENRLVLLEALANVPPRQRAVLVLRYWEDLSVETTAEILGCSTGTVKSQSARGLAAMRHLLPTPSEGTSR